MCERQWVRASSSFRDQLTLHLQRTVCCWDFASWPRQPRFVSLCGQFLDSISILQRSVSNVLIASLVQRSMCMSTATGRSVLGECFFIIPSGSGETSSPTLMSRGFISDTREYFGEGWIAPEALLLTSAVCTLSSWQSTVS